MVIQINLNNKKKLIIDVDGTITQSVGAIVTLYDIDYKNTKGYKKVHWTEINSWDFKELTLASKEQIDKYFDDSRFFEVLEFMENAKEIIEELSNTYYIVACTMGTQANLKLKQEWLAKNLPCVNEFIGVDINEFKDKSHIDMSGSIFVDDCSCNIETSNAECKILYGDIYDWNKDYKGKRYWNWTEIYKYLY
jgi:5'(3')-deoxyribonucleotidase